MTAINSELTKKPELIIFTDLDGTLLDFRYSYKEAVPALNLIRKKNIPLIICSSKTRAEIEKCRNLYPELMSVEQYLLSQGFDSMEL